MSGYERTGTGESVACENFVWTSKIWLYFRGVSPKLGSPAILDNTHTRALLAAIALARNPLTRVIHPNSASALGALKVLALEVMSVKTFPRTSQLTHIYNQNFLMTSDGIVFVTIWQYLLG